jgi:uncharacterized protein YbgA (DUF1722 family)
VVKPALVEISIYPDKKVEVVIDLSLEAAMTGIGTQYKNTTDAPSAAEYDELRALAPEVLRQRFKNFETKFLNELQLNINHQVQNLHLGNIKIDIVGYKKRIEKAISGSMIRPDISPIPSIAKPNVKVCASVKVLTFYLLLAWHCLH